MRTIMVQTKPFNKINVVMAQALINYATLASLRDELTEELHKINDQLTLAERTLDYSAVIAHDSGISKNKIEKTQINLINDLNIKRVKVNLKLNEVERKILEFEQERQCAN